MGRFVFQYGIASDLTLANFVTEKDCFLDWVNFWKVTWFIAQRVIL